MFGTLHRGSPESVPEFDSANSWNCEHRMSDLRLNAVPERLAISRIDGRDHTLHDRTQAVPFLDCLIYRLLPYRRDGALAALSLIFVSHSQQRDASKFHNASLYSINRRIIQYSSVFQNLLRHHSGSNHREGKAPRKMSAATRVLAVIPFKGGSKVCMPRTRHVRKQSIILRLGVRILKDDGQRRSRCVAFIHSTDDSWLVCLDTGRGTLRSALPAQDILSKVLLCQFKTGRNTVQHNSDEFAMRLTEYVYPEFSAECIHISTFSKT